jgi:hypothetical protein
VAIPNDPSTNRPRPAAAGPQRPDQAEGPSNIYLDPEGHRVQPEEAEIPRPGSRHPAARAEPGRCRPDQYQLRAGSQAEPGQGPLFIEDANSPYANLLVAREDNKDSAAIKKLAAALNSPDVKKFIEEKYQGAVVPAF